MKFFINRSLNDTIQRHIYSQNRAFFVNWLIFIWILKIIGSVFASQKSLMSPSVTSFIFSMKINLNILSLFIDKQPILMWIYFWNIILNKLNLHKLLIQKKFSLSSKFTLLLLLKRMNCIWFSSKFIKIREILIKWKSIYSKTV